MKTIIFLLSSLIIFSSPSSNANEVASEYSKDTVIWFEDSNSKYFVAVFGDLTVGIWELPLGKYLKSFRIEYIAPPLDMGTFNCFLSNRNKPYFVFYVYDENNAYLYDLLDGKLLKTIKSSKSFDSDGAGGYINDTNFAIPTGCRQCLIYDHKEGVIIRDFIFEKDKLKDNYFNNGIYLIKYNESIIQAFDDKGTVLWKIIPCSKYYTFCTIMPSSKYFLLINEDNERKSDLFIYYLETGQLFRSLKCNKGELWKCFSEDYSKIVFMNEKSRRLVIRTTSNEIKLSDELSKFKIDCKFSSDNNFLLCMPMDTTTYPNHNVGSVVIKRPKNHLYIVDTITGKIINNFELKKPEISKPETENSPPLKHK
jgi:hypothetical protein